MRRALAWLPAVFAAAAAAELVTLILVARWVGLPWAVLAFLATSLIGVLLIRREGIRGWRRFQQALHAGEPPGARVADGLVGLVGALLLVVPGFLTDVTGLLLLAPGVRQVARRRVQRAATARMPVRPAGPVVHGDVVDAEVLDVEVVDESGRSRGQVVRGEIVDGDVGGDAAGGDPGDRDRR